MSVTLRRDKGSPLSHDEMDNNINACLGVHNLLHVEDRKPSGTSGGTFTSGAWRTRDLNTVAVNNIDGASLDNNQVTLPAGEYWIESVAPAHAQAGTCGAHKSKIYNITDAADELISRTSTVYTQGASSISSDSFISGKIIISSSKTFELQHRNQVTEVVGFGGGSSMGVVEIYSVLKIWKVG